MEACTLGRVVGYDQLGAMPKINEWTRGYICVGCGCGPLAFGGKTTAAKYRLCNVCYEEAFVYHRLVHYQQVELPKRPSGTPSRVNAKVHRHVTRRAATQHKTKRT